MCFLKVKVDMSAVGWDLPELEQAARLVLEEETTYYIFGNLCKLSFSQILAGSIHAILYALLTISYKQLNISW